MRLSILSAAVLLCAVPLALNAQEWVGTVTAGGFVRNVYIPDLSRPVKACLVTNHGDPQLAGRPDIWLNTHLTDPALYGHPHQDLIEVGRKWNLMQMHWIGRPDGEAADPRQPDEEYRNIIASLKQLAAQLGKPEIEFTGIFIEGVSGTANLAGQMANMAPGRFAGVLKHHYAGGPEVHPSMACLYVVGGQDRTDYADVDFDQQMATVAPRARVGHAASLFLEPANWHDTADPRNQRFTALWLDAIITLRFPASIPTTGTISLASLENHRAWVGSSDATTDIAAPWNRGTRAINNVITPFASYTGTRPYIWLPTELVAQAWKIYMDSGYSTGFPTLPPLPTGTTATITAPAGATAYASGASITATASVAATSGSVTAVAFYDNGILVGTDTSSAGGWTATWTISGAGAHALTATATSSSGATGTSPAVTVQVLRPADHPGTATSGVDYAYYESGSIVGDLPDFSGMTPVRTGHAATFDITAGGPRADHFAYRFTGYLTVATGGVYRFRTSSDDGSQLAIGTTRVVDNNGAHAAQWAEGTIPLAAGKHAITVDFAENTGGQSLIVRWQGPDTANAEQDIPASVLSRLASVDTTPPPAPSAPTVTGAGTATQTLTGTTEPLATVRIYDGGALIATVVAHGDGSWSVTLTLAPGSHSLTVTARVAGGNVSAPSAPVTVAGSGSGSSSGSGSGDPSGGSSGSRSCGSGSAFAALAMLAMCLGCGVRPPGSRSLPAGRVPRVSGALTALP
jgi:hypothetical protein